MVAGGRCLLSGCLGSPETRSPASPRVGCGLNRLPCASRPRSAPRGGRPVPISSDRAFCARADALLVRKPGPLAWHRPDPEAPGGRRFLSTAPEGTPASAGQASGYETGKDHIMAKAAQSPRSSARVVQLRKGTTLEMVRLACPDSTQMTLIAESFGLPVLDSDGIRDQHERLIVESADGLKEGLGDRAMQIHLQRIVGAYVGSAHGAGQFYSKAVTEARDATAKAANDLRDEDLDGPVGFDSGAQRKREFAADMGVQAHALRMAAEGAVTAYEHIVGERWKPFERPVDNPGQSLDRKAAELQMAALG